MAFETVPLFAFNRGLISKLGLARTDIERTRLSASVKKNWMPRVLGSMMLRPGWEYKSATYNNSFAVHFPFIYSATDMAVLEMTNQKMRIRVNEQVINRPAVATAVSNGDFASAANWTDIDDAGATSTITGGNLELVGTRYSAAGRRQQISVAGGDQNVEHALRIVVERGPVTFRCGSTSGGAEYIRETTLGTGVHSLAFTPTGANVYIQFTATGASKKIVDSVQFEAAGNIEIPTPWLQADLRNMQIDQSADVVYVSCGGYAPRKIERRGTKSWSIVLFQPIDGPFRTENMTTTTISSSATSGDVTLTSSKPVFRSSQIGALFKLTSTTQAVESSFTAGNQFSGHIRVIGVGSTRNFTFTVTGTWTGTVTLQRSVGEPGAWTDVANYTVNQNRGFGDGLDNQIIYYRLGIKSGNYGSGTADITILGDAGSITGFVRITGFTNESSVSATVLRDLGATGATERWSEGEWSDFRGYPTGVALHDGRLWWGGKGKVWGSVSDAYESHDSDTEGDSAPLNRSVGTGPIEIISWLLSLGRLIIGGYMAEWSVRSSSLDEPLTKTNFSSKSPSTQGSVAGVPALKIDDRGLFVQKSGVKLYELKSSIDTEDYTTDEGDLMALVPDIGKPGIVRIAAQRQPDTRIHCIRADGTAAILVRDPAEKVLCWLEVETSGLIEDVVVLPGSIEDSVYYSIKRTVNGNDVRYYEKWAMEEDCRGGDLNKQADSFVVYNGASTATITGLGHLEGCSVIVWGDGTDFSPIDETTGIQATFTVSGGQIVLPEAVSKAVVGLPYLAQFQSAKLAYAAQQGTALNQKKKIDQFGLVLADTHCQGVRVGKNLTKTYPLPRVIKGETIDQNTIFDELDLDMMEFDGTWDTDSRFCLVAHAPRPCTVLAATIAVSTNEKPARAFG